MSLLDNLIHLWELDGDALDSIGGKDLAIVGGVFTTNNPNGIFPESLFLDGLDDTLSADDSGLPISNAERSIVMTFRRNDSNIGFGFGYGNSAVSGQNLRSEYNRDGGLGNYGVATAGHRMATTDSVISNNAWHLAIVSVPTGAVDTDDLELYADGIEEVLSTTAGSTKTLNTVLSGLLTFGAGAEMQLSQIAIYDKALTTEQKDELWNNGDLARIIPAGEITTVGVATAENNGLQGIDVSMPYSGDDNADSTYTVDYRISGDAAWTNWITNAPNTPSPFLTTIAGLADGNTYEVRVTYIDPDGVTGDNPQIITGIFMPVPVVPIITTHNQDAKNRLLEQYKKEPGIEGFIQSYFGTQVQDLENAYQELFGRLNIEGSVGAQLDGIGKIVDQDRLGLTDELYRLFLRARIGANVSEGDIERLIEVWKTITQANIVKLEEIFPAEINLATDVALPDNLIDPAFALIQEVSGAGIGVGITTFLPEDAFSFEGADPAITKGFGDAITQGTTDGTTASSLVDSGASFIVAGVVPGMVAMNDTDGTKANILIVAATELTLDADIFITGEDYYINANTGGQLAKIQGAN